MERPRILITTWRRPLATYLGERTVLDTFDPAYAARVTDAGGLPLIISRPPGPVAQPVLDEVLALADGLLLTGGGDIDPANYGAAVENAEEPDADADDWELALIAAARERSLPTLAVCRGAQMLAVAYGGRLAQQLAETNAHPDRGRLSPEAILSGRHTISLLEGSRVRRALGAGTVAVNTIHHHGIDDAGELVVTATAPDGVIEAVEPRSGWACVGVQWHPEKMHEPEQAGLFAQLVQAALERAGVAA
jgi:putative glutamine amidotransferase